MQGMEVKYSIRKGKTNIQKEKKTLKALIFSATSLSFLLIIPFIVHIVVGSG